MPYNSDTDKSKDPYLFDNVIDNSLTINEQPLEKRDPLDLTGIDDDELVKIVDKRYDAAEAYFQKRYDLKNRRNKNEKYLFGRQIEDKEKDKSYKSYEAKYCDNVIWEIEESIVPLAMSRPPEMIVYAGNDSDASKEDAKNLTKTINEDFKSRMFRKCLEMAFRHVPVYFVGVIKCRWNSELNNGLGDYEFYVVNPERIMIDHRCGTNNADDMDIITETVPISLKQIIAKFPSKKEKLFETLRADGLMVGEKPSWKEMDTEINIREVHYTLVKETEPGKYERTEIVLWKYKDVLLKKMKDPNFDYEGETKYFTYDDPMFEESKREVTQDEMVQSMMGIEPPNGIQSEQVYYNYFQFPRKPYFFMGANQWGKTPLDETSRIEQNIKNQENHDIEGKQLTETLKQRRKYIWSKDSGLKAEDVEKLDMENPKMDAIVEGDVNAVVRIIEPERPDAAQFNSINMGRDRMYQVSGSNAIRGEMQSEVATTNQIAREADYSRADLLVENTINAAAEWMGQWIMQMIKLRYTEEHMRIALGDKGENTFIKIKRDAVSDGMEVKIKASATDKIRRHQDAMNMAKMQLIDPVSFFEDMDMPDPVGRAQRLLLFTSDPASYMLKYIQGNNDITTQGLVQQLGALPPAGAPVAPQPGAPEQPAQNPAPENTANVPITPPSQAPVGAV